MTLMFIVHHFLRPIWSYLIKFIFYVIYLFKDKEKQKANRLLWENIKTLEQLKLFFSNVYKYKYDGIIGELDHDNPSNEFFANFGDCDDMGRFSMLKLKELGFVATRVGILNLSNIRSWHYDCLFEMNGKKVLFNYGNLIEADSADECIKNLGKTWNLFSGDKVNWWKCYW